jgi:hypothetical protein
MRQRLTLGLSASAFALALLGSTPLGEAAGNGAKALVSAAKPTAAKRYLIKVKPGNYDIVRTRLVLKPFVDLEGSRAQATRILMQHDVVEGSIAAAADSQLRDLGFSAVFGRRGGRKRLVQRRNHRRLRRRRPRHGQELDGQTDGCLPHSVPSRGGQDEQCAGDVRGHDPLPRDPVEQQHRAPRVHVERELRWGTTSLAGAGPASGASAAPRLSASTPLASWPAARVSEPHGLAKTVDFPRFEE